MEQARLAHGATTAPPAPELYVTRRADHALLEATVDLSEQREQQKEIEALRRKLASGVSRDLASEARDVGGVRVLATRVDGADVKALREVADQQRDKLRSGVIVLAGVDGDKIALVSMVTPDLVSKFNAGKILGEVAKAVGGKGGGRADMAQAGGTDSSKLPAALGSVRDWVAQRLQ